MAGGVGDPHMEAMDGTAFDFVGVPHRLHKLYSRGPLKVLARLTPIGWTPDGGNPDDTARQYISWAHIVLGDVTIIVGEDGKTRVKWPDYEIVIEAKVDTIDAPGHPGSTQDEPHPLQGVPHLNVTMPVFPPHRIGESGVWADGPSSSAYPEAYVVGEPGA